MKTPNSVSQKIGILLKTNTKKGFLNIGQLKSMNMKSMSMYSTQYVVGAPLPELLQQCGMAWSRSVCGTAQVL